MMLHTSARHTPPSSSFEIVLFSLSASLMAITPEASMPLPDPHDNVTQEM
jgi:hypothetical protein